MPVKEFALEIDQGADFNPPPFQWLQLGTVPPPAIVNITGYTAVAYFGRQPSHVSPLITISTTPNAQGVITIDGANGLVYLSINAATTATLPLLGGALAWSLWLTSSVPVTTVLVSGELTVWPMAPPQ
jgi:hypothetical protein